MALLVVGGLGVCGTLAAWRRIPPRAAGFLLALLGMMLGAGALLLQDDPGPADWAIVLAMLAGFTPVHFRFAFGPPGRAT